VKFEALVELSRKAEGGTPVVLFFAGSKMLISFSLIDKKNAGTPC
jgi:hypothetical protein